MRASDWLRVLAIVNTISATALSLVIIAFSWSVLRKTPPPHLMFWHVGAITAGTLTFAALGLESVLQGWHEEATWRLPVFLAGGWITNFALWIILGVIRTRRRLQRALSEVGVEG